jgi:class 3 adenylate cyclase
VRDASKLVLVIDSARISDTCSIRRKVENLLGDTTKLEIWDEEFFKTKVAKVLGAQIDGISEDTAESLRVSLDNAKGRFAFGDNWTGDLVQSALLWHLGFWRIEQLRRKGEDLNSVLQTGCYSDVVVLIADLSSSSSYVRDTRDSEVVRAALTSFFAKSRYEVLNSGGLLYECSGDQIVALYGVPKPPSGYLQAALKCARSISDVGNSISSGWQRHIDIVQKSGGVHIGMAFGNVEVIRARPFARIRFGFAGDCVNLAFRLVATASSGEIAVNNEYLRRLNPDSRKPFDEISDLCVKNVGTIRAFKAKL